MYLLAFKVFPLWKLHFIPNHLNTFLSIHSKKWVINTRDISLHHLQIFTPHVHCMSLISSLGYSMGALQGEHLLFC